MRYILKIGCNFYPSLKSVEQKLPAGKDFNINYNQTQNNGNCKHSLDIQNIVSTNTYNNVSYFFVLVLHRLNIQSVGS